MQFPTIILSLLSLIPLVSSTACVAGGPANQVTQAGACCKSQGGTWYQFYPNQAICVVADPKLGYYKGCISRTCNSELDTRCIPGNGEGLSTAFGSATYTGPRETITASP
ncbi:hypothetical protein GLAREA_06316 [Glarea lozoyensis ATCC 20868]|uniref:Uncharacterized protein n=1 Tax=Glarea lozoyensis (strain ATCC 20868 / MF5171) TaxID=1116229 RepID=S3D876_GLAL2|nr:uncharacterized protein GLAREA_06316 [Glarea lozoyensis ATCC 20868]EPE33304.1 hypothetical protein GLAREA_06316 [Glarea lozoyensis ATCC 20868]